MSHGAFGGFRHRMTAHSTSTLNDLRGRYRKARGVSRRGDVRAKRACALGRNAAGARIIVNRAARGANRRAKVVVVDFNDLAEEQLDQIAGGGLWPMVEDGVSRAL